jgi:hypothetical protein
MLLAGIHFHEHIHEALSLKVPCSELKRECFGKEGAPGAPLPRLPRQARKCFTPVKMIWAARAERTRPVSLLRILRPVWPMSFSMGVAR